MRAVYMMSVHFRKWARAPGRIRTTVGSLKIGEHMSAMSLRLQASKYQESKSLGWLDHFSQPLRNPYAIMMSWDVPGQNCSCKRSQPNDLTIGSKVVVTVKAL